MISESKWKQYGLPNMEVKGIVIHNTNTTQSAEEIEEWMEHSDTSKGCHFVVDCKEVRQVMPLEWSVFNTGMGLDFGNLNCIAIEICSHPSNKKYLEGQSKAIDLIKTLMARFELTIDDVYFHRDFQPNVNCPAQILKRYSKKEFLNLLKGGT